MLGFRFYPIRPKPGKTRTDGPLEAMQVRAFTPATAISRAQEEAPAALKARGLGLLPLSLDMIASPEQFGAISVAASDIVKNGRVVKFLIDRRRPDTLHVHFVNGNYERDGMTPDSSRYHYDFGKEVLDIPESINEFNTITYFTQDKRYIAGVVHTYFLNGSGEPIYGLQFYPQDVIREGLLLDAVRAVQEQISIPHARFAFVATGSQQTTATVEAQLEAAGLSNLTLDKIIGAIRYIPLNLGEAWGILRVFPTDLDDLRPTDIPVFDELPLDLSVVAGVITREVQDTNSHVNLKSKERDTPNMVLRDAAPNNTRLALFADKPVHFVVRGDDFILEETTEAVVAEKIAVKMNRPLITLKWVPETRLLSFDEMATGTTAQTLAFARRYGSKATNLGFLAHQDVLGRLGDAGSPSEKIGYELVPEGFAVPLQMYRNFVDYPPNDDLRQKLDALITAENARRLSPKERAVRVDEVQAAFLSAQFPPRDLALLRAKLDEVLHGIEKIKVRSSSNAEDVPNFDGAGLHNSFSAKPTTKDDPNLVCYIEDEVDGGDVKRKVRPKSLVCAVKGVYASLWNKRAIEERTFARINHYSVAMGLAIVPAYDNESEVTANAVVVTRILNTSDVYGYSLSVQKGNNLVTNPAPGSYSEVTIASFVSDNEPISLTVTRYAKPSRDANEFSEPILVFDRMLFLVDLAKRVEVAYCIARPGYYGNDCVSVAFDNQKTKSLDLEIKILADDRIICKQVREFGGQ